MARSLDKAKTSLPEGTYIELVRSLFATLLPTSIMTASFVAVGLLINSRTPDRALAVVTIAGTIAAIGRIAVLIAHRHRARDQNLAFADARKFERRYAIPYLCFAVALGAFGARAFTVTGAEAHTLVIGLLFGYGAGVAMGLALRPWISLPSIAVATLPTVAIACSSGNPDYIAAGMLLAVFLAGGVQSMVSRYRGAAREITMGRLMSTLARSDALTNLPNRLSLRERFEQAVAAAGEDEAVAVHCLDLDRFKPVNDQFGHPVGDALLKAVSERLNEQLRRGDFAARTGGDEFVVVQSGVTHPDQPDLLARRLARAIALPYGIDGHDITIGTSIGYALSSDQGRDLDRLIACADEALCRTKRIGGGIAAYRPAEVKAEIRLTA
jgi:diguanylate cyclase (GGDEF)-like protein